MAGGAYCFVRLERGEFPGAGPGLGIHESHRSRRSSQGGSADSQGAPSIPPPQLMEGLLVHAVGWHREAELSQSRPRPLEALRPQANRE